MTEKTMNFQDDILHASLTRGDNQLLLAVTDRRSGKTWGPVPLLATEVGERGLRRVDREDRYQIEALEELGDGVHAILWLPTNKVSLAVWVRIIEGELSILMSPQEVYNRFADYFQLYNVEFLPGLAAVADDGMMILPMGEGVASRPAGKPAVHERFLIYMEQPRWEFVPTMPMAAAHGVDGGLGMLMTQGDCEAEVHIRTDGNGRGSVGYGTSLKRLWHDPVDFGERELRIFPILPDECPTHVTAARVRRHALEQGAVPTKQRIAEDPGLAYVLDGFTMKLFHGLENEGPVAGGAHSQAPITYQPRLTFAEAGVALRKLKEAGIEKIHTMCVGWNARGHDGLYPTRFPIDARLGGETGFRELCKLGNELGYHINVHDNFMMNVPQAPDWDPDCLTWDAYGEPLCHGWWSGGPEYQSWGLALPEKRLQGHMQRVKDLGIQGMYYCDYMIQPLEVNYHPQWRGPRSACLAGQKRILDTAKKIFGSVAYELGTMPGVIYGDYCGGAGHRARHARWDVKHILDEELDVWSLAFSGLTIREAGAHNWEAVMHCLVWGRHPRDEWSAHEHPMPVLDDQRIACLAAADRALAPYRQLKAEAIEHHSKPAENVVENRFADGTTVVADFNDLQIQVNGKTIERPEVLL